PGNYEGVIEVRYPVGTNVTVKVPVEVTDNRSDACHLCTNCRWRKSRSWGLSRSNR
ncbi:hypothetical protein B1154_00245, partial [Enterococcus faecium]